jgi:hypothetical protein
MNLKDKVAIITGAAGGIGTAHPLWRRRILPLILLKNQFLRG